MSDPMTILASIKRPALLVRAAHFGQAGYSRSTVLRRLLPDRALPPVGQAFESLLEREAMLEDARVGEVATYSFARHIEVLIALTAEARLAACREPA